MSDGLVTLFICGPGDYTHLVLTRCQFCCHQGEQRIHGIREVFGGWCGFDLICGSCGQAGSTEDDGLRAMTEAKRDENISKVKEMQYAGATVGPWPIPSALEVDQ